jgi:hypothetical protein
VQNAQMRRNEESAVIFNCSFESSKSAKIEELFVENGLWEIHDFELTIAVLTIRAP